MKIKKKSRRVKLTLKRTIEKKVKAHRRKLRKEAGSDPVRRKFKSDVHIPNLWPFKAEMLAAAETKRKQLQELKQNKNRANEMERDVVVVEESN